MYVTNSDKVLRELEIIQLLFKAQFQHHTYNDFSSYILDNNGHSGIDGHYIAHFDLFSNVELFNIQEYKIEFTERFEKTNNLSLLQNQLTEIREKAIDTRDFYNENLTAQKKIVKDFLKAKSELPFVEDPQYVDRHSAVVTIVDYRIGEFYLGCNRTSDKKFWHDAIYVYSYITNNYELAVICQNIIEFVEKFEIGSNLLDQKSNGQIRRLPTGKKDPSQIELSEIIISQNKLWKGLPMDAVVQHFEILINRKNKNGETFLTAEQLISFLKKGFLNDSSQPKQKINCDAGEKGFVLLRFYELFTMAASQYGHPNRMEKFIKLFTDCFDNWDTSTIKPFFKPNKTKDKW